MEPKEYFVAGHADLMLDEHANLVWTHLDPACPGHRHRHYHEARRCAYHRRAPLVLHLQRMADGRTRLVNVSPEPFSKDFRRPDYDGRTPRVSFKCSQGEHSDRCRLACCTCECHVAAFA